MELPIGKFEVSNLIVVGDRVLIKPVNPKKQTNSGLYLPPGVHKKEEIYCGYVIKVGPGYPIPALQEIEEPWKEKNEAVKYVPLQPQIGDLAVYLQKSAHEVVFNGEKFAIVPHSGVLLLQRDEDLLS